MPNVTEIELNRDNRPPKVAGLLQITRLKAGEKLEALILSEALWGIWTHWTGTHSEPCHKDSNNCPGCKKGYPARWKGYLHCYDRVKNKEIFTEWTAIAADQLLQQCPEGNNLRGKKLRMGRSAGGNNGRLTVDLGEGVIGKEGLPKAKDPIELLRKLWGLSDKKSPILEIPLQ